MRLKINKKIVALILGGIVLITTMSSINSKIKRYFKEMSSVRNHLEMVDDDFVEMLNEEQINSVTFISIGNSIASGYSMKDQIIPLLLRNKYLINNMNEKKINYRFYQFARPQDNNDEHTYEYLINNTTQSIINYEIRCDYINGPESNKNNISLQEIYQYYPTVVNCDMGLNDIISEKKEGNITVIVYNGGIGALLDNITRDSEDLKASLNRDYASIEAFCKYVYLKNPKTQIYLCGIPDILCLGINNLVNGKYKSLGEFYPNVTYVEPAPLKLFYYTDSGIKVDIHYNNDEYLCLNKNIFESINNNYILNDICIDLCVAMRQLSNYIQFENRNLKGNEEIIRQTISQVLDQHSDISFIIDGLEKFLDIYKTRYGYDYPYTSKIITAGIINEYIDSYKQIVLTK